MTNSVNGVFVEVPVEPHDCKRCGTQIPLLNYNGSKKNKWRYDRQEFCTIQCHWDYRKLTEEKYDE